MSDYLKEGFIDQVKGSLNRGNSGGSGTVGSGQENVIEKIKVNGVEQSVDGNKAVNIPVPTKTSELENDEGFLKEHQDLSEYAKSKDVPTVPSNVSEFTNDKQYQTADDVTGTLEPYAKSADVTKQITDEVAKIVANAPEDFDTLKEMSDWIANHENDASAMNSAIQANKTDIAGLCADKADLSDLDGLGVRVTTVEGEVDGVNRNLDIQGLLDKFDGKLDQAYYDVNNGTKAVHSDFVCNTNPISCNSGDSINFKLGIKPKNGLQIIYFNESGYVSGVTKYGTDLTFTAPSGATYFHFNYARSGGVTPTSAGSISVFINNEIEEINASLTKLELSDVAGGKNILDYTSIGENFSENATGTSFSFSNGEYVITRVNNFISGIYTYSSLLNVLDGKKIRLSFDAKTDTSGMSIRFFVGNGNGYVTKELTEEYKRYASDFNITTGAPLIFYGNHLAGNMYIKNIMFEDITNSESVDSTYEPHIPSVKMLTKDVDSVKNDLSEQESSVDQLYLNALPVGSIVQIEQYFDTLQESDAKDKWLYLGTSSIQYDNGAAVNCITNVYRKLAM